tara:strand:- start:881 stop:3016 length:2136 start_codon:yes stop_codon:yes gene_type:complete
MAAPVLQFKRGLFSNLPALRAGEPGFTTDKYDLYVGIDSTTSNNKFVGSGRFWTVEGATSGSGVNLVEGTNNGTSYITLASPASLAGIVTYYFPGTQGGASSVLTNDGSGNLSWGAGSANSVLTGVTTVTGHLDIDSTVDISGITTFSNTTDNTLGNVNTGSVQLDGGLGVAKNVTVGGNLNVQGYAEFVGVATFKGGTINLGDADTDDINVGGEFISSLVPNADKSVDLGEFDKQWRDVYAGGSVYGYESLVSTEAANTTVTYTVTVASKTANHRYNGSGSGSGYYIDGSESPFITLVPGVTYRFDQAAGSNSGHPLRFYLEAQKTTGYTTNVTTSGTAGNAGAYTEITVTDTTPQVLHYQCASHGLMGNAVSTQSNVVHNNFQATFLEGIAVTGVSTFTGQIDGNGGANISGAETVLSSATVSDLTDNRVVIAGTSGALEDSANLTFNGSTLAVTGDATVSDSITVTKDGNIGAGLTVTGALDVNGGANIASGLTVTGGLVANSAQISDLTNNRVVIAGTSGELEDSGNLTFDGTTLAVTGAATVDNLSLNANTVTTSSGGLTLDSASGTTTVADDLTVNGTFTVLGSQSIINTETLKVEDSLIEVGLVNSGGSLVAPSSDANIDVGVVMHYYSGSAKTASIFWDDSAGRIVVADAVTESNSVMGSISYATLEIGALTVSDCQGNSQAVISCSGSTRSLENITVDGGSF